MKPSQTFWVSIVLGLMIIIGIGLENPLPVLYWVLSIVGLIILASIIYSIHKEFNKEQQKNQGTTRYEAIHISPEQASKFSDFVEEWLQIGLSTAPADRQKAEQAIHTIYKACELTPPVVVWCTSPPAVYLTKAMIHRLSRPEISGEIDRRILTEHENKTFWESIRQSINVSPINHFNPDWEYRISDTIQKSWRDAEDLIKSSIGSDEVWAARRGISTPIYHAVLNIRSFIETAITHYGRTLDNVDEADIDDIYEFLDNWFYGQHDAGELAAFAYFRSDRKMVTQTDGLRGQWELAQAGGWYLPYEDVCWISERPTTLHLNKENLLHCDTGPALQYPDGWGIYALNGVEMKPEYVLTPPAQLDPAIILKEQNVDMRRELLRKVGVGRMLYYGKEVDHKANYKLIDMSHIFQGSRIDYAPFLLMQSSSVDGAFHLEGVPPECHTVEEAINWRASEVAKNWHPDLLS